MKLNQATDYAFRMILHMSLLPYSTKITGSELAKAQNIPERFLLKIMRTLINAKIMQSFRGVDGGFALAKRSKDITLFDIIEAVEGEAFLQRCLYDEGSCSRGCSGHCSVQEVFSRVQSDLVKELKAVNFETLAKRERSIHKDRPSNMSEVI